MITKLNNPKRRVVNIPSEQHKSLKLVAAEKGVTIEKLLSVVIELGLPLVHSPIIPIKYNKYK
jgi:hypothetical protein